MEGLLHPFIQTLDSESQAPVQKLKVRRQLKTPPLRGWHPVRMLSEIKLKRRGMEDL